MYHQVCQQYMLFLLFIYLSIYLSKLLTFPHCCGYEYICIKGPNYYRVSCNVLVIQVYALNVDRAI